MRRVPTASNICQRAIFCARAPMKCGLSNQRKFREHPEQGPREEDRRDDREAGAEQQHEREPAPPVATANRTSAVIAVTTFASTIVEKPFL